MADKIHLTNLKNVNKVMSVLYDENGKYRAGFKPEEFYNTILLDSLKYGEENFVHLKYVEKVNIRKGETVARFRRWSGMTPTLRPLKEGLPPMPDKHAYEYIEVGNVFSFGRWSEYTDQIDLSVVSEMVAERSVQYGELANQIKELYARKTWLASPNDFYANFKTGIKDLAFGDAVTLDDLRFLTSRMKRAMVKPVGGKFNYICSQEFINGLIDDPRVKAYMEINQTTGNLWTNGECFPIFDLNFIPTMLDEFAYPDTEFAGVYEDANGDEVMRLFAASGNTIYYLDVHQDFPVKSGVKARTLYTGYLPDGTAVEEQPMWNFPNDADSLSGHVHASTISASYVRALKSTITRGTDSWGLPTVSFSAPEDATSDVTAIDNLIDEGAFAQLPVHRGILFGDEAMIQLVFEGISDQPQIIIKPLGSAGTNDPLNQRQSVGFKVNGFGLAIKRPEAICITYGIPAHAELSALSAQYVKGNPVLLDNDAYLEDDAGNAYHRFHKDGVNAPYGSVNVAGAIVDAMNKYAHIEVATAYSKGDKVQLLGKPFVVKSNIANSVATFVEVSISTSKVSFSGTVSAGDIVKYSSKYYVCGINLTTGTTTQAAFEAALTEVVSGDEVLEKAVYAKVKSYLADDYATLFDNLLDAGAKDNVR